MKVVIIGGVAAGLKSASKVRRGDPKTEITVLERARSYRMVRAVCLIMLVAILKTLTI